VLPGQETGGRARLLTGTAVISRFTPPEGGTARKSGPVEPGSSWATLDRATGASSGEYLGKWSRTLNWATSFAPAGPA
jgi:hypothetical protein